MYACSIELIYDESTTYHDVQLPFSGIYQYPAIGTRCLIAFVAPNKPRIINCYLENANIPNLQENEILVQQDEHHFLKFGLDGKIELKTSNHIELDCDQFELTATTIKEQCLQLEQKIEEVKQELTNAEIEASGAITMTAGSDVKIASAGNVSIASAGALNIFATKQLEVVAGLALELKNALQGKITINQTGLIEIGNQIGTLGAQLSDLITQIQAITVTGNKGAPTSTPINSTSFVANDTKNKTILK